MQPDETVAKTGANSDRVDGACSGFWLGHPYKESRFAIIGLRAGVNGGYTIAPITNTLDRGSGYTSQTSLGNPQGSAGADSR
ncbi:hypothetical protein [Mesorhizobium sp. B1-1-5]|uniref:hypothetical protein n=2 Tax=unclassified Mesorhizobium TaxID=325217 RepID=UPI0011286B58|nr:hypothetical protein [Mesorhizobium sp. B1-1-5]